MMESGEQNIVSIARTVGVSLVTTVIIGVLGAIFLTYEIDINISADIIETAKSMLLAETRLRAGAYLGLLLLGLQAFTSVGLYLLLRTVNPLLAGWALFLSLVAANLAVLGSVSAMNVAHISSSDAFRTLSDESDRLLLSAVQATLDYTSFHLNLVLSNTAMAAFFYLLIRSNLIPVLIAGWGVLSSIFVIIAIVSRDFFPLIGHDLVTTAFMLCNLVAIITTGLYLSIRGIRTQAL